MLPPTGEVCRRDGDFGDFTVGLFFMPTRPEEDRDNGDVLGVGNPLLLLLLQLPFTLLISVAGGITDATVVSAVSPLSSTVSSDLTGGSLGTRL